MAKFVKTSRFIDHVIKWDKVEKGHRATVEGRHDGERMSTAEVKTFNDMTRLGLPSMKEPAHIFTIEK